MLILGIESSCDDTCLALVRGGVDVIAEARTSQDAAHAEFGGVVPELAARLHADAWPGAFSALLGQVGWSIVDLKENLDAIAVTVGPGLQTSLLTGTTLASTLGLLLKKPVIGVHHVWGHIISPILGRKMTDFAFPSLCLTLSGGHTQLVVVKSWNDIEVLSKTRDDACGECFDKIARALGLAYPGGPQIAKMAEKGDPLAYKFPRPLEREKTLDFSFSGLKSGVIRHIENEKPKAKDLPDVCASVEHAVNKICLRRIKMAKEMHPELKALWLVGGVSANTSLKKALQDWAIQNAMDFYTPKSKTHCTDNAAMIAAKGFLMLQNGYESSEEILSPIPRFPIVLDEAK